MNAMHSSCLINLNRVLIFALTLAGLLMDGLQLSNLFCAIGLLMWLWLPLCTHLEARLLHWIYGSRGSRRSPGTSPSM
jgi:hypothetical protein